MHVEFLVEDASSAATVEVLLERLLTDATNAGEHSWRIHSFDGKHRLLDNLAPVAEGIFASRFADRIVVLIDADRDDCVALKQSLLERMPSHTVTGQGSQSVSGVWIRIAVTELESWFIGDRLATREAYPQITAGDLRLRHWQDADSVADAWEWLEALLIRRGHYVTRMPKVEVARNIARRLSLEPDSNTSRSFRLFLRTLREVYELPTSRPSSRSPST